VDVELREDAAPRDVDTRPVRSVADAGDNAEVSLDYEIPELDGGPNWRLV